MTKRDVIVYEGKEPEGWAELLRDVSENSIPSIDVQKYLAKAELVRANTERDKVRYDHYAKEDLHNDMVWFLVFVIMVIGIVGLLISFWQVMP